MFPWISARQLDGGRYLNGSGCKAPVAAW